MTDFVVSLLSFADRRNILVAPVEPVNVKLSDVGLARTLESSTYYRKTSDDKVPVKWMAPECIHDRKYSSKSRCVVLWGVVLGGVQQRDQALSRHECACDDGCGAERI